MSDEKDPLRHGFIKINGQTFVAPPPPKLEDGQVSFVSSFVMTGKRCPRCHKMLTATQDGVGGNVEKMKLPVHSEEDCDLVIVDEIHKL